MAQSRKKIEIAPQYNHQLPSAVHFLKPQNSFNSLIIKYCNSTAICFHLCGNLCCGGNSDFLLYLAIVKLFNHGLHSETF